MFSMFTNIYNKKTKWPALMELFTATGKLIFFFFGQKRCSMCAPRVIRHTSIRYSSSCHTHTHSRVKTAAFCLHRHPVSIKCLYHARTVLSVGRFFAYFARNARCTVTTDLLCDIPKHKTTSPPERPFSHYLHSHRLVTEMSTTMKKTYWEKDL